MKLSDIFTRQSPPVPWSEGDNIPWNEPEFSKRMLKEHLDQSHDAASRRFEIIDRHVDWIHENILLGRPSNILDLGCGPGFYLQRLAKRGHRCSGIDYSPASVAYARERAETERMEIDYLCEDIRQADYGADFNLVMLIFGELNVFRAADARLILKKAHQALRQGGSLLVEVHTFAALEHWGKETPSWFSAETGLFSDRPHICLRENFWDLERCRATARYFIADVATGDVRRHAASYQAYTDTEYSELLKECGFSRIRCYDSLSGATEAHHNDFVAIVASA